MRPRAPRQGNPAVHERQRRPPRSHPSTKLTALNGRARHQRLPAPGDRPQLRIHGRAPIRSRSFASSDRVVANNRGRDLILRYKTMLTSPPRLKYNDASHASTAKR